MKEIDGRMAPALPFPKDALEREPPAARRGPPPAPADPRRTFVDADEAFRPDFAAFLV
jgi:hypothetical protein